jgi:hypothetical protein
MDRRSGRETDARQSKEVPDSLKSLMAMAEGYKQYMSYLKEGGSSGISDDFPTLEIVEEDSHH